VKQLRLLLPAIALVTVLASIPSASGATLIRGVSTNRWRPKVTDVAPGTRVTWKAVSGTHTVTAYKGNWSKDTTLSPGETTRFTFNNTGVYKFRCRFHSSLSNGVCSGMCGRVVVG
jgi:plastocyanin